jgi:hypothetical protein
LELISKQLPYSYTYFFNMVNVLFNDAINCYNYYYQS